MGRPVLKEPVQQKSGWTTGHLLVVHCCRCPQRSVGRLSYARWPSAEKWTTRVKGVGLHMWDSVAEFLTVVQDLGSDGLSLGLLRCPLDIRRGNPRTSSW